MRTIGMYEARSKFAELVEQAKRGETIVVTRNGEPVAELRPVASKIKGHNVVEDILALNWTLGESLVDSIRASRDSRG